MAVRGKTRTTITPRVEKILLKQAQALVRGKPHTTITLRERKLAAFARKVIRSEAPTSAAARETIRLLRKGAVRMANGGLYVSKGVKKKGND